MTGNEPDGIALDPSGAHLFVANQGSASVSSFAIGAGGALAPVACAPVTMCQTGNGPGDVAIDPSGTHLYTANFNSDSISVFSIDAGGRLSPVACDPATICMTGSDPDAPESPEGIVIDPSGRHLYVANVSANSISAFAIGAGGVLAPIACDAATICRSATNPTGLAIDPTGTHLYATNVSSDSISVFAIGADGVLSPVSCDPTTSCRTDSHPRAVVVDPTGTHLYVTNVSSDSVSVFAIGAGGVLSRVACHPSTSCMTGSTPQKLAIDRSGRHLYVTNRVSESVSVFDIGPGGVLAPVACDPPTFCVTGQVPVGVAVDPSGAHLYVTNQNSFGTVSVFSIGSRAASTAPVIGGETVSPRAFRAASSGPSVLGSSKAGTTVTYTLTVAANVCFTVQRRATGRVARHGARTICVPLTKRNRKQKGCTRWVNAAGSFVLAGLAGTNRFRFTGRLNAKRLAPGSYRLLATPTAHGKTGLATTASFAIILRH